MAEPGVQEHPQRFSTRSPKILSTSWLQGHPHSQTNPQHPSRNHWDFQKGAGSNRGTQGGFGGLTPPSGCCR